MSSGLKRPGLAAGMSSGLKRPGEAPTIEGVSLQTTLSRVAELRGALVPGSATPPGPAPSPNAASFAAQLQRASARVPVGSEGVPGVASSAPGPAGYPHLSGDLDADPQLLARLEHLAAARGERWTVTSGRRSRAEQQRLWDARASNPFPVARPGTSRHESGRAADVLVDGRPIQAAIGRAQLVAAGLAPLAGDAVHVELPAA